MNDKKVNNLKSDSRSDIIKSKIDKIIFLPFILISVFILLLIIFYLFIGDRTIWSEYITIWPPILWIFFIIPIILALNVDRVRLKKSLFLLGKLIFFLILTVEWQSLVRFHNSKLTKKFDSIRNERLTDLNIVAIRLITWNINDGSGGKETILNFMENYKPDMCFLQETPDGKNSFEQDNLQGYWSNFRWIDAGDCGILSRFPFEVLESDKIGPWSSPLMLLVTLPNEEKIIIVNVRLMIPSLIINIIPSENRKLLIENHRTRIKQFENLANLLNKTKKEQKIKTVILLGDFNTPGKMASLNPLKQLLNDVWSRSGVGWGGTMTDNFPMARIDQCWITKNIIPVLAKVHKTHISDHRMLIVELIIPKNN